MESFPHKILVASDSSEDAALAAGAAIRLSGMSGSELHLVHVGHASSAPLPANAAVVEGEELAAAVKQEARRVLDREVERIRQERQEVSEAYLRMGKADEEIIATAEEIGADLIVVGSRGHSGIKRFVLGSVSESVVRHAPCPVLVVREEGLDTFPDNILLATDGSADSGHAAEIAAQFSGKFDSELHVVHVGHEVPTPHFESWVQSQLEEEAQKTLAGEKQRIEEAGGTVAQAHLKLGPSAEEIVNLAEELGVGAVVMGSRGLDTTKRMVVGSVSESVVRHAHCSVLVVRRELQDT